MTSSISSISSSISSSDSFSNALKSSINLTEKEKHKTFLTYKAIIEEQISCDKPVSEIYYNTSRLGIYAVTKSEKLYADFMSYDVELKCNIAIMREFIINDYLPSYLKSEKGKDLKQIADITVEPSSESGYIEIFFKSAGKVSHHLTEKLKGDDIKRGNELSLLKEKCVKLQKEYFLEKSKEPPESSGCVIL